MAGVDPDDEVSNRSVDLAEPMWRARGNDDNVARFEVTARAALYGRAACAGTVFLLDLPAIRCPDRRIDQSSAGHERRRALHHVINLRDLIVQGGGLGLVLGPVEHTDANIVPACVDHSNIWESTGLSWP